MNKNEICVISHSGGLDSSTLLALALKEGRTVLPLNFNYGQKNIIEMTAQQNIWTHYKKIYGELLLETLVIDFTNVIGDALNIFSKNRDSGKAEKSTEMKYYMPSRNLLFMSTAAVIGEILANDEDIKSISLGLGIHQHSDIYAKDYWDISPEFSLKLGELLKLNDNVEVTIFAPYANKLKKNIIYDAMKMNLPLYLTWTCYEPVLYNTFEKELLIQKTYVPCLGCEACLERQSQAYLIKDTEIEKSINKYSIDIISYNNQIIN